MPKEPLMGLSIENRIHIREEFKESIGMIFFQSLSAWKGVQSVQIM